MKCDAFRSLVATCAEDVHRKYADAMSRPPTTDPMTVQSLRQFAAPPCPVGRTSTAEGRGPMVRVMLGSTTPRLGSSLIRR